MVRRVLLLFSTTLMTLAVHCGSGQGVGIGLVSAPCSHLPCVAETQCRHRLREKRASIKRTVANS